MQYVILDLEWNQPINFSTAAFKKYGDRLMFELIQIGAVRLSDRAEILDTLSIPIRPQVYRVIHPIVRKMTHLTEEELSTAVTFPEAMQELQAFCGTEETVFLTWGCDDFSVLRQNMDFYEVARPLPTAFDIQPLFMEHYQLPQRMNLSAAMELMGIEEDPSRFFHNALHDAYYSAEIFSRLPSPESVTRFPVEVRPLFRAGKSAKSRKGDLYESISDALKSPAAAQPHCPVCARPCQTQGPYVPQSANRYVTLSQCRRHGNVMVKLQFHIRDGMRTMQVTTTKADRPMIAYVHTKWQQAEEKRRDGRMQDPEIALARAEATI
ncbi:MAG: exonuclease domain-containing protein [Clostridia bacterium]|nr:exonuclease domain-containing protein [Clostridia bacterium]